MKSKKIVVLLLMILVLGLVFTPVAEARGPIDWVRDVLNIYSGYELPANATPIAGVLDENTIRTCEKIPNTFPKQMSCTVTSYTDNRFVEYGDKWYLVSDLVYLEWDPPYGINPPPDGDILSRTYPQAFDKDDDDCEDGDDDCEDPPYDDEYLCGNNKYNVCHEAHTICISENAVEAHLRHGDYLGECSELPVIDPIKDPPLRRSDTPILTWNSPEGSIDLVPYFKNLRGDKFYLDEITESQLTSLNLITNAEKSPSGWKWLHALTKTAGLDYFGMDIESPLNVDMLTPSSLIVEGKYVIDLSDFVETNITFTLDDTNIEIDLREFATGTNILLDPTTSQSEGRTFIKQDATVKSASPSANFGTNGWMNLSRNSGAFQNIYVQINYSNLSNIDDLIAIQNAELNLYLAGKQGGSLEYQFYYSNDTFNETNLTWNNQFTEIVNRNATQRAVLPASPSSSQFHKFNYTADAIAELTDDQTFISIGNASVTTASSRRNINTKEGVSSLRPYFEMTYTVTSANFTVINETFVNESNETYPQNMSVIIEHKITKNLTNPSLIFDGKNITNITSNTVTVNNSTIYNALVDEPESTGTQNNFVLNMGDLSSNVAVNKTSYLITNISNPGFADTMGWVIDATIGDPASQGFVYDIQVCSTNVTTLTANASDGADCNATVSTVTTDYDVSAGWGNPAGGTTVFIPFDTPHYFNNTSSYIVRLIYKSGTINNSISDFWRSEANSFSTNDFYRRVLGPTPSTFAVIGNFSLYSVFDVQTTLNASFNTPLLDANNSGNATFFWEFDLDGIYENTGNNTQFVNLEYDLDNANPSGLPVTEGDITPIIVNGSARNGVGSYDIGLQIGTSNKNATLVSAVLNNITYTANVTNPFVASDTLTQVGGTMNVTFENRTINRVFPSLTSFTVYAIDVFENISASDPISYRFFIKDEADLTTPIISDLDAFWEHWHNNMNAPSNSSTSSSGSSVYNFTYENNAVFPTSLITNSTITYGAPGFGTRFHSIVNGPLENATNINITLYLLATAASDVVKINIIDEVGRPQPNVTIKIRKHNIGNGTSVQVAEVKTSDLGSAISELELAGPFYSFILEVNGTVRRSISPFIVTETEMTFVLPSVSDFLDDFTESNTIQTNLKFNRTTNITTYDFTNPSGIDVEGCLRLSKTTNFNFTQIFLECETTSSGTITYNITGQPNGTYFAEGQLNLSTGVFTPESLYINLNAPTVFGIAGALAALFIIGVVGFIFIGNPVAMIVGVTLAVFAVSVLGLFSLPVAAITGVIFTAILLIFRMRS